MCVSVCICFTQIKFEGVRLYKTTVVFFIRKITLTRQKYLVVDFGKQTKCSFTSCKDPSKFLLWPLFKLQPSCHMPISMSLWAAKKIPNKSYLPHQCTRALQRIYWTCFPTQSQSTLFSFTVKRTAEALGYTRNPYHLPHRQNHRTDGGLGPSNYILEASFHSAQAACTCPHLWPWG